jgi:hypothetical protein
MNLNSSKIYLLFIALCWSGVTFAQPDDLLALVDKGEKPKEYINNAFKSSRVINGHSMEFIGKGVLDVRILHRFGDINTGFENLYGLDQASMRFGFDYGLTRNLTLGIGRSTLGKEWDGFVKYRLIQQSIGGKNPSPVSLVFVTGTTVSSAAWTSNPQNYQFTDRMGFYNQLILGRKFSEIFSLQLAPTYVHKNLVEKAGYTNDFFALGIGARYKFSKRTAFVVDYHVIMKSELEDEDDASESQFQEMKNPLSIGFDIETGGHVFQLHFTNSNGMNEKAFITNTKKSWGEGQVSFGFNLSRVFTVAKK